MTVDGTHFAIHEPNPFDERWYSHKYNGAAVAYEVVVCIQTGRIVWINGPFPGSWHDLDIFHNDFVWQLEPWEMVRRIMVTLTIQSSAKQDVNSALPDFNILSSQTPVQSMKSSMLDSKYSIAFILFGGILLTNMEPCFVLVP